MRDRKRESKDGEKKREGDEEKEKRGRERERGWSPLSGGPSNEVDRRSVEQKSSLGAKG